MATIGEILAARKAPQPWDAGQGVVPDQPAQAPIDPAALAASANAPQQAGQSIGSIADDPMAQAQQLEQRQGAAAQLASPQAEAFQASPLNWMALGAMLGNLLQQQGKARR